MTFMEATLFLMIVVLTYVLIRYSMRDVKLMTRIFEQHEEIIRLRKELLIALNHEV